MDETNPTARALQCLDALQDRPGITADGIGELLGVSSRAARRYVEVLRAAGIPVVSERGPYGGYRLGRGTRPAPLRFTAAEALGLVMAVLDGHHEAADLADPVGSALGKLVRVLPEPVAEQAEAVRRTTSAAPDRAAVRPDPGTTAALVQAISTRRQVGVTYRSEAGTEWETTVDPWSVVVRHGRWYLLCWSHAAQDRRTYRVDRVRSVELLDATFTAPPDLDPVAALEEQMAVGWEYAVEVLVDAPFDQVARRVPRSLGRLEEVDETTTRLVGSTSNPYWYAEQLAVVPAPFRVLGGDEVRECVAALGRRLSAAATS